MMQAAMGNCARCTYPLTPVRYGPVEIDYCYRCGGSFLEPGETAVAFGDLADPSQWGAAGGTPPTRSALMCPSGHGPMWSYRVAWGTESVEVDGCGSCRGLWVDAGEGKKLFEI